MKLKATVKNTNALNVREFPNQSSRVLKIWYADKPGFVDDNPQTILSEKTRNDWIMVYLGNGKSGFAMKKFLEIEKNDTEHFEHG